MQQNSNQLNISSFKRWWLRRSTDIQSLRHGHPDKKLKLIAITGSAGKTSVANILHHILSTTNSKVGLIASTGIKAGTQELLPSLKVNEASASDIYEIFEEFVKAGIEWVIVETGLTQLLDQVYYRLNFENAIVTNIFPIENEAYAEILFEPIQHTKTNGLVVINGDDKSVPWLTQQAGKLTQQLYAAWCKKEQTKILQQATNGTAFNYMEQTFQTKLFTDIGLENLILAARMAMQFMPPAQVAQAVSTYVAEQGRLQLIASSPFSAIVDKARIESETPVLDRLLFEFTRFKTPEARLIVVIDGLLGQEAVESLAKYAKVLIVAPGDPATHDVTNINTKLLSMLESHNVILLERFTSKEEYQAIDKTNFAGKVERVVGNGDLPVISFDENTADGRYDALQLALQIAKLGDIVAFLGKGDDRELNFGEMHYDWNEAETAKKLLSSKS
jgi:UDP-N-acetylmuramoyl-L-alanyl-D-glutamate--2,6-diaminopimelate ligase